MYIGVKCGELAEDGGRTEDLPKDWSKYPAWANTTGRKRQQFFFQNALFYVMKWNIGMGITVIAIQART